MPSLLPHDLFHGRRSSRQLPAVILWIIFCNIYSILMSKIRKISYMCTFYISIKFICIYIVKVKVAQSCPTLCDPVDYIVHVIPNPGIKPMSPALQADSLQAETQRKPKNIGVGSLSLLQQIFPTQGLNQGLLHCRWILYQLSYQGSPWFFRRNI